MPSTNAGTGDAIRMEPLGKYKQTQNGNIRQQGKSPLFFRYRYTQLQKESVSKLPFYFWSRVLLKRKAAGLESTQGNYVGALIGLIRCCYNKL